MSSSVNAYTAHFAKRAAVEQYLRKFDGKIDRLRHEIELANLRQWAFGSLFDCSIAGGRFIARLDRVTCFAGMDYSEPFLDHIRRTFPGVPVQQGDLTEGINQKDNSFDTVICMRTLFALERPEKVVAEMVRITRPKGRIIFDYGVERRHVPMEGEVLITSASDLEAMLSNLQVREIFRCRLDGVVCRLKRHRLGTLMCEAIGRLAIGSALLRWIEERFSRTIGERVLLVLEKI